MHGSFGRRNEEALGKAGEAGERRERVGRELGKAREELERKTDLSIPAAR
jgi:hypothetical protein